MEASSDAQTDSIDAGMPASSELATAPESNLSEHDAVRDVVVDAVLDELSAVVDEGTSSQGAEPVETGDVRVDAAIARLSEVTAGDDAAAVAVLSDVHDRLHHVLLNP